MSDRRSRLWRGVRRAWLLHFFQRRDLECCQPSVLFCEPFAVGKAAENRSHDHRRPVALRSHDHAWFNLVFVHPRTSYVRRAAGCTRYQPPSFNRLRAMAADDQPDPGGVFLPVSEAQRPDGGAVDLEAVAGITETAL